MWNPGFSTDGTNTVYRLRTPNLQNSLKWAMMVQFSNKEILRDVFIAAAALNHMTDMICRYIAEWVFTHRGVHADWSEDVQQRWLKLYQRLGVNDETAEILAIQL